MDLQYSTINNLHEYSVVILDLQNENKEKICVEDDQPNGISYLFELSFPQKEFIPDPLVLSMMQSKFRKQCLKIIFAGNNYIEQYNVIEVLKQNQYSYPSKEVHSMYEIIQANVTSKYGKKIKPENNSLANFIEKYAKEYKVIFELPTKWDGASRASLPDPNFIPLLKNQDGEVISYIGYSESYGHEILLLICEKQADLIERLVTSVLPEILPDFFLNQKSLNG